MNLLLLSNTANYGSPPLQHCAPAVHKWLGIADQVLFVPYALADHDGYTERIAGAFHDIGVSASVVGLHQNADPRQAIRNAQAIFIGGGNSFRLLDTLYNLGLREIVSQRVRVDGLRYMGSSAGTNMACPTIRTSNDMPIVEPPSFEALGLVPFQINPHYQDPAEAPNLAHMGETRETRLNEFLEQNDVTVLGLREGTWLEVRGGSAKLGGEQGARVFERNHTREVPAGSNMTELMNTVARFDSLKLGEDEIT